MDYKQEGKEQTKRRNRWENRKGLKKERNYASSY
jgi:hypothetical protein